MAWGARSEVGRGSLLAIVSTMPVNIALGSRGRVGLGYLVLG